MNRMNDGWTDRHVLWASPPRTGSDPSVTAEAALEEVLRDTKGGPLPA